MIRGLIVLLYKGRQREGMAVLSRGPITHGWLNRFGVVAHGAKCTADIPCLLYAHDSVEPVESSSQVPA